MKYVNVNEIAAKWNLSERSVRNYCAHGKIPGVILDTITDIPSCNTISKSKLLLLNMEDSGGCRKAGQKETSGKNSK